VSIREHRGLLRLHGHHDQSHLNSTLMTLKG
jgi:hypothetical protein